MSKKWTGKDVEKLQQKDLERFANEFYGNETEKTKRKFKDQPEYFLQKSCISWLRSQYPNVLFFSDTVAFTKLSYSQQQRNKAIQCANFSMPDIIIFAPNKHGAHSLFIELKAKTPFRVDGITLLKNEHIEAQAKTIRTLNKLGFEAHFCWSFEQFKSIVNNFFKTKK
jgi:hypothetical protein